jgi:hypothetical protein
MKTSRTGWYSQSEDTETRLPSSRLTSASGANEEPVVPPHPAIKVQIKR